MGTTVFPFRIHTPGEPTGISEGVRVRAMSETIAEDGTIFARSLDSYGRYGLSGVVILTDNDASAGFDNWHSFMDTISDGADTCLVKAVRFDLYTVTDEAAGTASGGGGEEFALARKFIDSSTLVVKIGGVTQTLTTDYTFSGNNTAPLVTTTASADTGAVLLSYEYYYQCFVRPQSGTVSVVGTSLTNGMVLVPVTATEQTPGGSYA